MKINEDNRLCNLIAKCLAYGRKVGIVSDDDNIACLDLLMRKDTSWSKGDEMMLKLIISELEQEGKDVNAPGLYRGEIDWLKSLHPQPKQEWSEVELTFRGEKVKVKRPFYRDDNGRGYSTTEQDEDVAWYALRAWCEKKGISMYDLYPREEWSEEDEEMRKNIIWVLESFVSKAECEQNSALTATYPTYFKEIAWLKSLRPVSKESLQSWKPSEEQMEAFKGYIEDFQAKAEAAVGGWNNFDVMIQLFEQLNKLMQKG